MSSKKSYHTPAKVSKGAPKGSKVQNDLVSQMNVGASMFVAREAVKADISKLPQAKRGEEHRIEIGQIDANAKVKVAGPIRIKRLNTTDYLIVGYTPKMAVPARSDTEGMKKWQSIQRRVQGHALLKLAVKF